jgi:hypothetical protein
MRVQFQRLFKRHPDRRAVAFRHRFGPQHDDVDTPVRNAVRSEGPGDAPGRMITVPWFVPRFYASLQRGDNLIGDPFINIRSHFLPAFG